MRVIAAIAEWFDHRLQLAAPIRDAAEHPVPRNTASWWYVFGSAALVVFCLSSRPAFSSRWCTCHPPTRRGAACRR
jgi:hypothetical protein